MSLFDPPGGVVFILPSHNKIRDTHCDISEKGENVVSGGEVNIKDTVPLSRESQNHIFWTNGILVLVKKRQ